jgi:hypothetical protein
VVLVDDCVLAGVVVVLALQVDLEDRRQFCDGLVALDAAPLRDVVESEFFVESCRDVFGLVG